MEISEFTDINGRTPKVGDKVAVSMPATATVSYMRTGVISNIVVTESQVRIYIYPIMDGYNKYIDWDYPCSKEFYLVYPAHHCKYVIL